jgi:DNA-binding transcriptional ArsR family regulator
MDEAGAVFAALADGTRRELLAELGRRPASATQLAAEHTITRQAVAKHLAALSAAGLVRRERSGREVVYRITPEPLSHAATWMAEVGGQWDQRLAHLARSVEDR